MTNEPTHLVPPAVEACCRAVEQRFFLGRLLPRGGFGPRGFLLLLMGLLWMGPAWWKPRFLWAMAAWDALVVAVWAWGFLRLPRPEEITVRRVWNQAPALGTPSQISVEIKNGGRSAILAWVVDDVPERFRREPPVLDLKAAAGKRAAKNYSILPAERGDTRLGRIFVRYQGVSRIAERWAAAEAKQSVRVYPNLEEARRQTIYLIRTRQVALERRLKRHRGQGRDFESLREYRPGDPWRDICWTASARRSHLVTKVYQIERSQTVWIVLDAGRLLRARVNGPSKLDYAINAALSLAQVALYSGDRVAILAYGRRIQQQIPPGRGAAHLRAIVERLALVETEPYEANHMRAAETLLAAQSRRSLVVWLTDLAETPATPEVIESALQMTWRHLVLFGVIRQPELAELASTTPESVRQMYHHVAAQEMLDRRELLLRRLRQQGAMAMEFEPGQMSPALVNQYLDVKERNLL